MSAYFRTLYEFSSKFILVCLRSTKKLLQKFASLFTFYFNYIALKDHQELLKLYLKQI